MASFFCMCQQPPGPRGPTCCQPAPPVCSSCVCGGGLLSLMPARRPRRRAGPAAPGLPAGAGQRARRRAKLFPSFAGRAGPRQKGLRVITRYIFANRRCGLAPFPLAAFSSLEIADQGPGMASLRRDGKWPGVPAAASRREAARRPRVTLSLAATGQNGSWRAPAAARARTGRVRNGGRPANSQARRHGGKARPWPPTGDVISTSHRPSSRGRPRRRRAARPGSSPGGPRLAQVIGGAGTALAVSRQPDRKSPIWSVRHQFPLTVPERRLGDQKRIPAARSVSADPGPAPRGLATRPASLLTGGPRHGGRPRWPAPPGPGRRLPAAAPARPPKTRSRTAIAQITERARKVPESGVRSLAGTLSRGYLATITPLICDVRSP